MNKNAYIALISVLIISAIALVVSLSASLTSTDQAKIGLKKSLSSESLYFASSCAEEALMRLRENTAYLGNETLTIIPGACQILPIELSGSLRLIKVISSYKNQFRKIKISVDVSTLPLKIDSWQEVADF